MKSGERRSGMNPDAGNTGDSATRPASTEGEQTSREAPGSACREICRRRQFHGEHSIRAGDAGKIRQVRSSDLADHALKRNVKSGRTPPRTHDLKSATGGSG
jgi:hypothetical protein